MQSKPQKIKSQGVAKQDCSGAGSGGFLRFRLKVETKIPADCEKKKTFSRASITSQNSMAVTPPSSDIADDDWKRWPEASKTT